MKLIKKKSMTNDKITDKVAMAKNVVMEIFDNILKLNERQWYQELIALFKVRHKFPVFYI